MRRSLLAGTYDVAATSTDSFAGLFRLPAQRESSWFSFLGAA